MANKEIWDYLSATPVTPDYNVVLDVNPQKVLVEDGQKNQVVHLGDDDSEAVISFSDTSVFNINLQWEDLNELDAGTIFDFYHDPAKAKQFARSFKWQHHEPTDPHIYTVRFASKLPRQLKTASRFGITNVRLKILGRAP